MANDTQTTNSYTGLLLSKVPEVTVYFWLIKVLSTTVGETAADFLGTNLNLGLTTTSFTMGILLAVALVFQFWTPRYIPGIYWISVILVSIMGTLITDNLSDNYHVPLEITTAMFSAALMFTFTAWYAAERTLSIHTIFTPRREGFYWLAILFTFAPGTAAGDLTAEKFSLGYGVSIAIFGGIIAAIAFAHYVLRLNAVLSFWLAYIMTRPLGASIGDFMSQHDHRYGGLG